MVVLLMGLSAVFLAIVVAVLSLSGSTGRTGVAEALASIDTVYAPGSVAPSQEDLKHRTAGAVAAVTSMGRTLTPKGATAWLQRRLDYAGNPPTWPPTRLMEMQGVCLLAFTVVAGAAAAAFGGSLATIVLAAVIAGAAGFWAPFVVVFDLGQRRQEEIKKTLPDALDLLTLSVEAGLGFDAAMAQVATSTPNATGREFARVLQEMQVGVRRADALRAMAGRTTVPELRSFSTSLVQAGELGIPIANVLREQAREMRVKRRQWAEERARKVPVKVIFPLIMCLFPAIFIVIIGPGVIRIMEAFSR